MAAGSIAIRILIHESAHVKPGTCATVSFSPTELMIIVAPGEGDAARRRLIEADMRRLVGEMEPHGAPS